MHLLRIATSGSVDDGKSTLIGRLLYETGQVPADRLAEIEERSRRHGLDYTDLSLLTEVCENISPGMAWPPRMTTICPLGPSAVSPIASVIERFRDEFDHYIMLSDRRVIPVAGA